MSESSSKEAHALWRTFHAKEPREEIFLQNPGWPRSWGRSGEGLTVYYRSDKWNEDGDYVSYYHDHEGGVQVWEPWGAHAWLEDKRKRPCAGIPALQCAVLGWCLGWDIRCTDGETRTVEFSEGTVRLCGTPSRKALFAVHESSGDIIAVWCGGKLNILPEGIDG